MKQFLSVLMVGGGVIVIYSVDHIMGIGLAFVIIGMLVVDLE